MAARISHPSSAIIIQRYTKKPADQYRASPSRLGRKLICSSPRPPSLSRWLKQIMASRSPSSAKRISIIKPAKPDHAHRHTQRSSRLNENLQSRRRREKFPPRILFRCTPIAQPEPASLKFRPSPNPHLWKRLPRTVSLKRTL